MKSRCDEEASQHSQAYFLGIFFYEISSSNQSYQSIKVWVEIEEILFNNLMNYSDGWLLIIFHLPLIFDQW